MSMRTPTLPPAVVAIQPGTTVQYLDALWPAREHQTVCCCPWWHAVDARGRWYVERACGGSRVDTAQAPARGARDPRYAEHHAADVADRLNRVYLAGPLAQAFSYVRRMA